MARVLIAGCGYVGSELGRILGDRGHEATGIRRSPGPSTGFPVEALDLLDEGALRRWLGAQQTSFDAVVVTIAAGRGDEDAYREAYVAALRSLQQALLESTTAPPALFVCSSTSVYAQDAGEWVDESSATRPASFRGRIQLEAEAQCARWPGPHAVLRLGGIYGPGRTRLLRSVGQGEAQPAPRYTNRIHRDDAAGALAHLVLRGSPPPERVIVVDDTPARHDEVVAWIAEALGNPMPPAERAERVGAAAIRGKRCRNTLLRELGYAPRYPSFREGYRELIDAGGY